MMDSTKVGWEMSQKCLGIFLLIVFLGVGMSQGQTTDHYYRHAVDLYQAGKFQEAAHCFATVLRAKPRHDAARLHFAWCLIKCGALKDALPHVQYLHSLQPRQHEYERVWYYLQSLQKPSQVVSQSKIAVPELPVLTNPNPAPEAQVKAGEKASPAKTSVDPETQTSSGFLKTSLPSDKKPGEGEKPEFDPDKPLAEAPPGSTNAGGE